MTTNTHGGGTDQTAVIGHAPESRGWAPGDPTYAPLIDPRARIEAYATVDAGLTRPTYVMQGAWLMKHVHVGHDAFVGPDVELSPGVVVCGHAHISKGVRIGVNACVLPFVYVATNARIGAGAVVTRDVPAGQTWVGNPARELVSSPSTPANASLVGRNDYRSTRRDAIAAQLRNERELRRDEWNGDRAAGIIHDAATKFCARGGLTSKLERGPCMNVVQGRRCGFARGHIGACHPGLPEFINGG